jgi:hypothetical protein
MFQEVADKPSGTNGFAPTSRKVLELDLPDLQSSSAQGFPNA